ncbi:hypothetical protein, partial [Actinophytocola sp.]|uniref:hypothetical protein n=1 Tax=Actinophytocola sp. TaxID=1872138 RepID=UPI002ED4FE2C
MVDQTWEVAFATLVNGLPETVALPRTSDAGAVPVAAWRRDRFGVVLVVRRWRNGALAHDLVPSWRDASGEWESSVYGGSLLSGPPDDPPPPPVRAGTIEWINESSTE